MQRITGLILVKTLPAPHFTCTKSDRKLFSWSERKSGLLTSSETLFYDKTILGGSYCAAFGCSNNSYSER